MGPRFWLQAVPVVALAVVATIVGLSLAPHLARGEGLIVGLAVGVVCFAGAVTFQRSTRWVVVLLVGLSLAAGVVIGALDPRLSTTWAMATAAAVAALGVAAAVGRAVPRILRPLYRPLWLLAVALTVIALSFNLSLVLSGVSIPVEAWRGTAAAAWWALFFALAAAWFAWLGPNPSSGEALHLYLLWLNLFLSTSFLIS